MESTRGGRADGLYKSTQCQHDPRHQSRRRLRSASFRLPELSPAGHHRPHLAGRSVLLRRDRQGEGKGRQHRLEYHGDPNGELHDHSVVMASGDARRYLRGSLSSHQHQGVDWGIPGIGFRCSPDQGAVPSTPSRRPNGEAPTSKRRHPSGASLGIDWTATGSEDLEQTLCVSGMARTRPQRPSERRWIRSLGGATRRRRYLNVGAPGPEYRPDRCAGRAHI